MSRYRKIDPRIHNDAKYMALSERGQRMYFSILTHPSMTSLGAMRATEAGLCEEMANGHQNSPFDDAIADAYTKATGEAIIKEEIYRWEFRHLIEVGLLNFDRKASCLVVPNFLKYNPPESVNVIIAWFKSLDLIPECTLKAERLQEVMQLINQSSQKFSGALNEAFRKSFGKDIQDVMQDVIQDAIGDQGAGAGAGAGNNKPPTPFPGGAETAPPSEGKKPRRQTKRQKALATPYSPDFLRFYEAYPNKNGGKDEAWRIWQERKSIEKLPPIDEIMSSIEALIPGWAQEDNKFVPMITTFLNQGRWSDADTLQKPKPTGPQPDPNCPHCHGRGIEMEIVDGVRNGWRCRCLKTGGSGGEGS